MPLEFRRAGPAIAETDVFAFESRIGCALPSDYRAFLLTHNGGRPDDHIIRDTTRGDVDVKIFFGLRNDEFYDIDAERRKMQDRIPSRLLSIAEDDFGNRFCMSSGLPDPGTIYFWDHEEEAEEGEDPTERNLYHVADSFTEFWERMEPIDPDEYLAEKGYFDAETDSPDTHSSPPHTNGES